MTISVSPKKFVAPLLENAFFDRVIRRVRALFGFESAAAIDSPTHDAHTAPAMARIERCGFGGIAARCAHQRIPGNALLAGQDPIGRRLHADLFSPICEGSSRCGGDVKLNGLDVAQPVATIYSPLAQLSESGPGGWNSFPLSM